MSSKQTKPHKGVYEPGTLPLAFGNRLILPNVFIAVYLFFTVVNALGTALHFLFFRSLRTNTDFLTNLLVYNQVEKVEAIGTDKSLALIGGTTTEANAFDTPIQVAKSIHDSFYYTYENLLFVPLDAQVYLRDAGIFIICSLLVLVFLAVEVWMVRRSGIIYTTFKENKLVHYPKWYRILRGTAFFTAGTSIIMFAIIVTM